MSVTSTLNPFPTRYFSSSRFPFTDAQCAQVHPYYSTHSTYNSKQCNRTVLHIIVHVTYNYFTIRSIEYEQKQTIIYT